MPQAIYVVVAYIVEYFWVVQVAIAAVSVYSTFAAYSAGKKAERAAERATMMAQNRNSYRNFLNPLTPRRIIYGRTRVAGPFLFLHNPNPKKKVAWMVVGIASHEIEEYEDFWLLRDKLEVVKEKGDWGEPVSLELLPGVEIPLGEEIWTRQDTFGRVTGKYGKSLIVWPFKGEPGQNIGRFCRDVYDPRKNGKTYTSGAFGLTGYEKVPIGITTFTEEDKMEGLAVLVIRSQDFTVNFAQQSPDFAATVKGKRVYDPRTGTRRWTANAALCIADYLTEYMGFPWEVIDLPALTRAANVCDEPVPVRGGGFQPRYEINGVVSADQTHSAVLEMMADAMAGKILYASGVWKIMAGAAVEPSHDVDESMVLEDYELAIEKPTRSLPNAVRGTFFDEYSWQPSSFPSYEDAGAIAADGGVVSWMDVELPLTTSHEAAQRIARIMLRRARSRMSLSISMDLRGMLIQAGDVIRYTAPELGLSGQLCEVDGWQLGMSTDGKALTTRLDLSDYDPGMFEWDEATDTQPMTRGDVDVDSSIVNFLDNVRYQETVTSTEGTFAASYDLSWTPPELEGLELSSVYLEAAVVVFFEDGTSLRLVDSATVTSATGTLTVSGDMTGKVYSHHEVEAFARAKLSSNQSGPNQEATPMVI